VPADDDGTSTDGTGGSGAEDAPVSSGSDAAKEALARARAAAGSAQAASRAAGGPNRNRSRRPTTPGSYSGSGPDGRDPQLFGTSIERMLRERGWEQPTAVGGLTGRWAEIVGPDVAEHVVPETFEPASDGPGLLLVLRADSSAWAYTMRNLLPDLRRRIDHELGAGAVRDITVLGPAAPSWKHGRFHVKGRGPRDTYG
jgi:predicted nucleic acid-binding Zn ribbon protein